MNETLIYGIAALLICFTVETFFLSRLKTDEFPEDYEFQLDPFWYITGVLFTGTIGVLCFIPELYDTVKSYGYGDFILPIVFAVLIYFGYLFNNRLLTNLLTLAASLIISFMQPDTFRLFPEHLSFFQDRLIVAALLYTVSKGLGLLNGLGAISSLQFMTVMIITVLMTYFGAMPQILCIMALAYAGTMLAFLFYSWPPEKIIMSDGAFASIGFIMGCFMLNGAVEFAEVPMFIAGSYLFTETGLALYNRYIDRNDEERLFMNTSYFRMSDNGQYELGVVRGIFKIMVIDIVLSIVQLAAYERLAFPVFTVALNLWFLSILSGDTKPDDIISIRKIGKTALTGVFRKKKGKK